MTAHHIDLPDWAVARGRMLNRVEAIDPRRSALVIVDMQHAFLSADAVFGNAYALAIVPAVNRLACAMRDAGGTVIWTRQTVSDDPPRAMPPWQYDRSDPIVARAMAELAADAPGHAIHPGMAIDERDIVIDKYRYSAFLCPDRALEAVLVARGIELLVIAGTLTNVCCESAARDGNMLGYRIVLVADATAAVTDAEQNAALLNVRLTFADVRSTAAVVAMLER